MKLKFTLFAFGIYATTSFAQTSAKIDTNDISAKIRADGMLFDTEFTVPKGSGKNSIYDANLWIGGIDNLGQLHLAAQTYAQNGADYFYGPIATNYSTTAYTSTYNNVWKVDKATINAHILNYNSGGYIVPPSIANWPGNGSAVNGEAAILAPYIDVNANTVYDPANGDYPNIRGDQALFYMVNDDKQVHGESGGAKMGIEVHGMAYSYSSANDSALNQTLFMNFQIFNRSQNTYDSVYFGVWTDMDLGDATDDYIGGDSLLKLFFTYNSDAYDSIYGNLPPAQGMVFLNSSFPKLVGYNNDFTVTGNPQAAIQFYQYLKGRWKDNSPITYGGTGYGGTVPVNYMFSGNPLTGSGWTELAAGNVAGDRRGVSAIGPYYLPSGQKICVDVAYPFARDYFGNNLSSVSLLKQRTQVIQNFYNNQGFNCPLIPNAIKKEFTATNSIALFPNPTTGKVLVQLANFDVALKSVIEVNNVLGEVLYTTEMNKAELELDLTALQSGIYFVKISNAKGSFSEKVVKE